MSKNVTAMKSRTVYSVEGFNSPVHVVENTDAEGTDIQVIFQRKNGTLCGSPRWYSVPKHQQDVVRPRC